jgi:hypothetical protein
MDIISFMLNYIRDTGFTDDSVCLLVKVYIISRIDKKQLYDKTAGRSRIWVLIWVFLASSWEAAGDLQEYGIGMFVNNAS